MLSDRLFYFLTALFALGLIALALVWPQGMGAPSPGPFRRPVTLPEYAILEQRKAAEEARAAERAQELARTAQAAESDASEPSVP
ncbi:hypothetical protein Q0812_08595 [Brevundimonas sp. 2R-24]|uniref:Uncharacterized protein n=1 Tax=Peiella sedimenti TaxID=3061083 RepID=A0ABT8SLR6_9CAUL|nr:hypothetical protein [Caulobacteraceae bacterium XZ-24]